jgi:hypothetical protein
LNEIDYLLREYKERRQYLTDALSQGNVATIEEYRYICGQLRGLEAACSVIADLKQRMENSDNE